MTRGKLKTEDNKVVHGLMVISEAFDKAHITEEDALETAYAIDFIHYFEKIKDWRDPDKIEYKLQNLLLMAFLIILSRGVNSFQGIASYVRVEKEKYERYGLIENGKCPSHDTFRRVFELLDAQSIYDQTINRLYDFLRMLEEEILGNQAYKQIMVDGKEVKGSGRSANTENPKKNVQVLNVYDCSLETCIHSEIISEKTNEIPVAQNYLKNMNLKNTVVTADALHCQRETASVIAERKGIYVLTVKDNQPLLRQEILSRIENNPGRIETIVRGKRTFHFYHLPKGYAVDGFSGMKTFVKMETSTHSKKTRDGRCFISNTADNELIYEAIENRWEIENGLHREKDSVLREDAFRSTYRNTVLNMAVMNNLALQLIRIYSTISGLSYGDSKSSMKVDPVKAMQKITSLVGNEKAIDQIRIEMKKIKKFHLQ